MRYHGVRSWHQGLLQKIGRNSSEDWPWVCATVAIFSLFIEPPSLQSNVLSGRDQLVSGQRTLGSRICLWLWSWSPKVVIFRGHEPASAAFLAEKRFPWRSLVEIFRLAYSENFEDIEATTCSLQVVSIGGQGVQKISKLVTLIQTGHTTPNLFRTHMLHLNHPPQYLNSSRILFPSRTSVFWLFFRGNNVAILGDRFTTCIDQIEVADPIKHHATEASAELSDLGYQLSTVLGYIAFE